MRKNLLLLVFAIVASGCVYAQRIETEVIEIEKQKISGYTITFTDYSVDEISLALEHRLVKKGGLKSSKMKKFTAYLNQKFPEFGLENYDIYTKIVSEGKKENLVTKVYFAVDKGNMNPVDEPTQANVEAFVKDFVRYAIVDVNEARMFKFNESIKKEQKNYDKLMSEKKATDEKLFKLNNDISKSKAIIDNLQSEINRFKAAMEQ